MFLTAHFLLFAFRLATRFITHNVGLNSCTWETLEVIFVICELMNLNISELKQHGATGHHMTRNCRQLSAVPLLGGSCDECGDDGSAV